MEINLIAKASISIDAPRLQVWEALVNPEAIHQYMFGTHVVSEQPFQTAFRPPGSTGELSHGNDSIEFYWKSNRRLSIPG
jgi:uncharacterized protein YndB with AHSA1/START domain